VDCYANITLPAPPTVYDNCGVELFPTGPVEGTVPECEGDVTYTWTYTDCEGNTRQYVHTVTIDMPDFTVPADEQQTVECPVEGLTAPATPVVYDHCGTLIEPTLVSSPTTVECEGPMVWVYNYTDCAGSSHDWTFTYLIEMPPFIPPSDDGETVDCPADGLVAPATPVVYDLCGNPVNADLVTAPPAIPCEGTMVWVYNYTDCAGNSADWSYTYTIVYLPFAAIPPTTDITDCYQNIALPAPPTVYDNCGVALFPTGPIEGTIPP